ncbi:hypothetical protein ACPPVW_06465 [Leifsonia sp. McL0607]|uniref:hypothetical protein n=1 Tax=Leifsonia sp. McL0607 TaxID=3415672 RepID=UPI003CF73A5E
MFADFQDYSIPWAELIRARTAGERERAALEAIGRASATIGVARVRASLQGAAAKVAARQAMRADSADLGSAAAPQLDAELLGLAADMEELCPPLISELLRRLIGPHPHHWWFDPINPVEARQELTVAEVGLLEGISRFAVGAGLPSIQEAVESALREAAESERNE